MFLVDRSGAVKEIFSFDECPNGEFVFTKKKEAEDFSDLLLDKKIANQEKHLNHLKSLKHKKDK